MTRQQALVAATVIALLLPFGQKALAQETVPMGTMTATIDGDTYEGQTLDVPSEGTSTAEVRSIGPMLSVSIQAHDPQVARGNGRRIFADGVRWITCPDDTIHKLVARRHERGVLSKRGRRRGRGHA